MTLLRTKPRTSIPGQPSKKRTSGNDGTKDPQPSELTCAVEEVVEEALLGAIPPEEECPGLAEPTQRSSTRKVQHPVYFVSLVLRDARERYPKMQELLLAILIASRKLRPYFKSHPITMVSQYNLSTPLENPLATRHNVHAKTCVLCGCICDNITKVHERIRNNSRKRNIYKNDSNESRYNQYITEMKPQ